MSSETDGGTLTELYSERFGEPLTADEVYGYWLFVSSVILAVIGVGLALAGGSFSQTREIGVGLAAVGLAGTLTGLVIGQSFRQTAKYLVYLGVLVCIAAAAWFTIEYPGSWNWNVDTGSTTNVVLLYLVGIALIAMSGVMAPVVVGQSRAREAAEKNLLKARGELHQRDEELAEREAELEEREAEIETAREEIAQAREEIEAERTRADQAESSLDRLYESNASFQMYQDKADEWRWRLVHQNSNIIAASGEGYASDRNARRGMRSVKRNSVGADVFWDRDETEPEPEAEPIAEESRATFELYRDAGDEHRWRLRHDNGEIIAAATRGFSSRSNASDSIESVRTYVAPADYLEFDPAAFEVFEDAAGEYRWRLVHRNGRILADSGEGYASRSNARRAVETVERTVGEAEVGAESGARFEVFEDSAGEHRWRLVSRNDEIIADSGEGYTSRSEAENAVSRVRDHVPAADTLTIGEAAIELFEDSAGEHRWRLRHRNGTILCTGGEGYSSRSGAIGGVTSVKRNASEAPVEEGEE